MARLKRLLYPGETELLREGRSVFAILAWLVAPAVPLVLAIWFMSHVELTNQFLDVLKVIFGVFVALFLFVGGFQFLMDFALIGVFFDHWRIAVTDQRVLVRRGLMGASHDEMARYEIENCLYDRAGGKIVLSGAGRELAIDCSQAQAGRILKALGRDEAGS
jgi:hypothetical protein